MKQIVRHRNKPLILALISTGHKEPGADGTLESHAELEKRLLERLKIEPDLFDEPGDFGQLVEKAHDIQGENIAYVRKE